MRTLVAISLGLRALIIMIIVVLVGGRSAMSAIPAAQENPPVWFNDTTTLEEVRVALEKRAADVNAYYEGRTGLMRAIALPSEEKRQLASLLLQYGADPNLKEDQKEEGSPSIAFNPGDRTHPLAFSGNTALHIATFMSNLPDAPDRVALLLSYGADPNMRNGLGDTALQTMRDISPSNTPNFITIVRMLFEAGVDINAQDVFGLTFLHMLASERNAFPLLQIMKDQYGMLLDFNLLADSKTPAQLAWFRGFRDITCLLNVNNSVKDPSLYCDTPSTIPLLGRDSVEERDAFKRTGLMLAVLGGMYDYANQLLENNINIEAEDDKGYRALHYAPLQWTEPSTYVQLLLNNKASPDIKTLTNQDTPLHFAVDVRSPQERQTAVKALVKAGAQVTIQNKFGDTPLHKAVRRNHLDVIKVLMDASPLVLDIKNRDDLTPALIARRLQLYEAAALLGSPIE